MPYFLVASPTMLDASFQGTVILMLSHDDSGAHGLVINRPLNLTVKEVAENLDLSSDLGDDLAVLWGGPVEGSTGSPPADTVPPGRTDGAGNRRLPAKRLAG